MTRTAAALLVAAAFLSACSTTRYAWGLKAEPDPVPLAERTEWTIDGPSAIFAVPDTDDFSHGVACFRKKRLFTIYTDVDARDRKTVTLSARGQKRVMPFRSQDVFEGEGGTWIDVPVDDPILDPIAAGKGGLRVSIAGHGSLALPADGPVRTVLLQCRSGKGPRL